MNAEQKKRADELVSEWNTHYPEYVADRMAALLQELIDAPEPKPVARVTGYYGGYLSIATVDGRVLPTGTALYLALAAPPHHSEHHLEMVNTQAPSVPDGWRSFLTDVITSAGLLAHGKRDKGLASRIGKFAFDAMLSAQQPEPPADVVQDSVASEPVGYLYTNLQSGEYHVSDYDDDYRGPERALWCIEPVYRRVKGQ